MSDSRTTILLHQHNTTATANTTLTTMQKVKQY